MRGSDLPGFPTRDDYTVHSAVIGNTHLFGTHVSNSVQISFFRYGFLFDQRLNQNGPRTLGFNYDSASAIGQGPPFFNLSGYSPVGGAITGPRTSVQNTYEVSDTLSISHGTHLWRVGDAAIYYAITVAALFNFYNRWVSSSGVHAVSHEGHRLHGAKIAERGYVRA